MNSVRVWIAAMLLAVPAMAAAQEAKQADLEKTLWDVDQQWLCDGPYQKPYAECVKFRSQYWVDGFFEVQSGGTLRNKEEMVATQSAASPATGVRPFPADFRLMAVYGDIALGTDHTDFKTARPDGTTPFASDSHCLRVFVRQSGVWRPAAAALVPVIPPTEASAKTTGAKSTKSPDEKLEKELSEIDQKWMDAVRTAKIDYLKGMYADKWFEILGWLPTVVLTKPMAMERVAHLNFKPGEGLFADQFKLMAVYGDVALATDRRVRKTADANGNIVSTPHRALLVFAKENGQWKVVADAAVPTMVAE
ncbi:MAG TPA: nuclear transport factor 2 family protein [Candidatus Acidoferrales bacterium]|jgi:ketosteroid isomerase-like protein|nr:nuclear transport factor 2 family protein [Candidatus Acidoferrales bacterium]